MNSYTYCNPCKKETRQFDKDGLLSCMECGKVRMLSKKENLVEHKPLPKRFKKGV